MFFQFGADPKDRESVERITAEPVERKQNTEPNRCTAAQTPRERNLFHDRIGKRKGATTRLFEESVRCLGDNWGMKLSIRRITRNCNRVVHAQCNTETIEAGTKIRSARRNANRNLLHK